MMGDLAATDSYDVDPITGAVMNPSPYAQGKFERIASAIGGGMRDWLATPGRAYKEGLAPEEATNWGASTALSMLGVGAPVAMTAPARGASVGIFGGKLAETADLAALRQAKAMEKTGTEPGAILDATGWEKRPDKEWRFEINDRDAAMRPDQTALMQMSGKPGPDVTVADVFHHPDLYAAYPWVGELPARRLPAVDKFGQPNLTRGGYDPQSGAVYLRENLTPEQARLTMLHETQHAIQGKEGFAEGGGVTNPSVVRRADKQIEQTVSAAEERFNTLRDRMLDEVSAQTPSGNPARAQIEQWKADNPALAVEMDRAFNTFSAPGGANRNVARYEAYRALQGETEARNVAARADLIPEQRYLMRPEVTEDVARALQWSPRSRRGRMGDVADTGMMQDTAAPVIAKPATLFDYSNIHSVPDVKQFDLPRYEPPRGVSERVENLVKNKRVQNQMLDMIERGKGMNAETFYYNEPLRQAFIDELGKKKGQQGFERYMDYVAASSPRSDVEANARNASYYYALEKQGLPVPAQGGTNPQPYGHMAQNLHRLNAEKIRSGDYFDPFVNPKPLSFSQNLQGNFAPVTVDAHAFKLPAMLAKDPDFLATSIKLEKGEPSIYPSRMLASGDITMADAVKRPVYWSSKPNANEYGAMEQYYKRLAAETGMSPAQVQAAAWAGGGKLTGLESVAGDPFMRAVENRANKTAAARGISPAEALSQMMRGKAPLLGLGGAAALAPGVMGGIAAQDNYQ